MKHIIQIQEKEYEEYMLLKHNFDTKLEEEIKETRKGYIKAAIITFFAGMLVRQIFGMF